MSKIDTDVYNFINFMKNHYCKSGDGQIMTHTSLGPLHKDFTKGKGSFSITGVDYEIFLKLYERALPKMDMHIVERPKAVGPMVIDIDFKTHKGNSNRQYSEKHLKEIIKIHNELFKKYLVISDDEIKAFVFEKPSPTYVEKDKQWKDGFHILYPEIPLDVKKRYFFFDKAKEQIIEKDIFDDIPFVNTYEQILDSSVINSNGILMYGSKKEGREPYELKYVYNYDLTTDSVDNYDDDDLVNYFSIRRYCNDDNIPIRKNKSKQQKNKKNNSNFNKKIMSEFDDINYGYESNDPNNKSDNESDDEYDNDSDHGYNHDSDSESDDESDNGSDNELDNLENEINEIYDGYVGGKNRLKKNNKPDKKSNLNRKKYGEYADDDYMGGDNGDFSGPEDVPNNKRDHSNNYTNNNKKSDRPTVAVNLDIAMAISISKILKKSRADVYDDWIRVGWAMHGVSPTLLPEYIEFSKKSKKWEKGCCEEVWKRAEEHDSYNYTIRSLQWWAREDNLEQYLKILREQMNPLINDAKSGTHDDIANVAKEMYKHMYKCVSIQKNIWYEFQGSCWVMIDSAHTLKERIHSELTKEFFVLHTSHIAMADAGHAADQDEHIKQSGRIQKLYEKLKNNSFVKAVVECCAGKLYDKNFEATLNTNPMLIGFKNGVYDLETKCFRKGTPDDLISMTTGYDFKEYTMDSPEVKKVEKYFSQIHKDDNMRGYVLRLIASFLDGRVKDQKFVLWTGHGSNGKSTTISLIHETLGDYSGTLASQVVTRKRGGAGQATPDLADKMGKRFLAIQEPDPEDQIYVGQMKELSAGNDKISARALYGNPFYYKPQFKMVLCCNKLPMIPSNDGGTWRRLRVTPWEAQFVDSNYPEPLQSHQFYKDPKLEDDMKRWPQPFMWLLLNKYYPEYCKIGLCEPEKVTQFTNKYKKDSDVYLEYLTEWTEDPEDPEYTESLTILYKMFKMWYREAYATNAPPQKEFNSYLEGKFDVERGKVKGIRMKIGEE